jgi:AAA domain, putative AbiEii toxin, Type IV TA system
VNARATPSLRIARLVVENFRTFHGPTEIPLASDGIADEVAVFHGENGAGKSNALAALDLFFRAVWTWMLGRLGKSQAQDQPFGWESRDPSYGLLISSRDWPPGVRDPLVIEVTFAGHEAPFSVKLTPAGNQCFLRVSKGGSTTEIAKDQLPAIQNSLEAPLGPGSIAFFRLDARRRHQRAVGEGVPAPATALSPELASRLLDLATSFEPVDTDRWRAFTQLVSRFKTLAGREVNVVRMPDGSADLRFEIRGRQILRVSELSSGEQQVVAMCAAVLTSRAAIVAVEEPEISLHPSYQELVRDVLREQVRAGLLDQIILESHVPVFDGPEVIRFSRSPEGATSVVRQASDAGDAIRERARALGADEQWVTPGGYTKLPGDMVEKLGLQAGGYLWFLPADADGRWEAWTAPELDRMFGLPGAAPKK